jgi:hypothetical protein
MTEKSAIAILKASEPLPEWAGGLSELPAIIVRVHSERCVDLLIYTRPGTEPPVVLVEKATLGDAPGQWSYPQ